MSVLNVVYTERCERESGAREAGERWKEIFDCGTNIPTLLIPPVVTLGCFLGHFGKTPDWTQVNCLNPSHLYTLDDFNEEKNPLLRSNNQVTFNTTHLVASWPVAFTIFLIVAAHFIILRSLFKPVSCTAAGKGKEVGEFCLSWSFRSVDEYQFKP